MRRLGLLAALLATVALAGCGSSTTITPSASAEQRASYRACMVENVRIEASNRERKAEGQIIERIRLCGFER
jgi:hypothetical protein